MKSKIPQSAKEKKRNSKTNGLWNIRFGQIFRHRLSELEKHGAGHFTTRFQDCFYYHPHEEELFSQYTSKTIRKSPLITPYENFDLNKNIELYRKHFTPRKAPKSKELDRTLIENINATFILVPSFEGQWTPQIKPLEDAFQELIQTGLDIRWAQCEENFTSAKAYAKNLNDVFSEWTDLKENIIFIGYGFGILVILEVIQKIFRDKVKAIVSLAGALIPSHRETAPQLTGISETFELYRNFQNKDPGQPDKPIEARLVHALKKVLDPDIPWAPGVRKVIEQIEAFADDLVKIPENLDELLPLNPKWHLPENLKQIIPENCDLFSISAICPREFLKEGGLSIPTNPDDLFLYLTSNDLYEKGGPFTDTQLMTQETRFPPHLEQPVHHLATLKTDHWGLAFPRVLSETYCDPFPRKALIESLILCLEEYYSEKFEPPAPSTNDP